jgi:REP element-mobilizing transposase RayT/DNA-binding response OmpR family regulator
MPASILVATPHIAFGELLRISLEDNGQYQVRLVNTASDARSAARQFSYRMAILDSALEDQPFPALYRDLLAAQKGLRLVVIPPENNPNHPALGGIMPHGYLKRPFYLPELLETVSQLLRERETEVSGPPGPSPTLPPWLVEPLTLRAYLGSELAATQAIAGIIGENETTPGSGVMKAAIGALEEDAAQEVSSVVFRYWNRSEKTDLMRYIRLASDKRDFLIYATQIKGNLVLMLVYQTGAPLSQIRPQAKSMAQTLATLPPENYLQSGRGTPQARKEPAAEVPPTAKKQLAAVEQQPAAEVLPEAEAAPPTAEAPQAPLDLAGGETAPAGKQSAAEEILSAWQQTYTEQHGKPDEETAESLDDLSIAERIGRVFSRGAQQPPPAGENEPPEDQLEINLYALLGSVPPPDPEVSQPPAPGDWPLAAPSSAYLEDLFAGWDSEWQPEPVEPPREEDPKALEEDDPNSKTQPVSVQGHPSPSQDENLPDPDEQKGLEEAAGPTTTFTTPDWLDLDLNPPLVPAPSTPQADPSAPALLRYTCVLIPCQPQNYLTGDLATKLSLWVPQLCQSFAWRLDAIAVRPEYMQWSVQVFPAVSPGNLVRIIRQRTSYFIFDHFPHYRQFDETGDFWAPGYLVVSGDQPPSYQLLREYIAQTRKRQGMERLERE